MVVEIVSPDDETWDKLGFYAAHTVDKLLIVDPQQRTVTCLGLEAGRYVPLAASGLLRVSTDELAQQIVWPEPA